MSRRSINLLLALGFVLLVVFFMVAYAPAQGLTGGLKMVSTVQYEWMPYDAVTWKTGTIHWSSYVEIDTSDIFLNGENVGLWLYLNVDKSSVPWIFPEGSQGWWKFSCASMLKATETEVKKVGLYCTGYPTFDWGEEYAMNKLTFEVVFQIKGNRAVVSSGDMTGMSPRCFRITKTEIGGELVFGE